MTLDRDRVTRASAAWVWVPDGAVELTVASYRLIRYPERFWSPSFLPAMVTCTSERAPVDGVVGEVVAQVRAWGLGELSWWVSDRTPAIEAALIGRGAQLAETVRVLALDLRDGRIELDVPPDVATHLVRDEATLRAATLVRTAGWEQPMPDEPQFAADLARTVRDLARWSEFKVVATIGGSPVATGGCEIVDGVARLWSGVTLPEWRGRGAYRAVLRERLTLASRHGADMALVKGRVGTSGPILRRAGFSDFGEERRYRLVLDDDHY
jgi:GNAT superfamily N-acetyltransferase